MSTFNFSPKFTKGSIYDTKPSSPGPIYDVNGIYRGGINKTLSIEFPKGPRSDITIVSDATQVDFRASKLRPGTSHSIGERICVRNKDKEVVQSVSYVYEFEKYRNFQTGPSFSFARSKTQRFRHKDDKHDLQWVLDV